jgi:hypothetical protein
LAKLIIKDFHSQEEAEEAEKNYQKSAKSGCIVGDAPRKKVRARFGTIANLLIESGLVKSLKEIMRNQQTRICYDGNVIDSLNTKEYPVEIKEGEMHKLQYGKKVFDLIGIKTEIEHHDCFSINLQSYGYDEELMILEVKFKDTGKIYEYYNVPVKVIEDLEKLISEKDGIGGFFNKSIRNVYSTVAMKT